MSQPKRALLATTIPMPGRSRMLFGKARIDMATQIGLAALDFATKHTKYDRGWDHTDITYTVIVERPE